MDDEKSIERLNELLPQLNQQDKLDVICRITDSLLATSDLLEEECSNAQIEFLDICSDMEDDSNQISVIQTLANSLVK
jgi:hypothetical protein